MSVTHIALFLWLADVCGTMKSTLGLVAVFGSIVLGWLYIGQVSREVMIGKWWLFFITFVLMILMGVYCVIPNKNTLYLMGGAYAGGSVVEKVSTSEEYKKLIELFNLYIDKSLTELKKEEKK